MFLLDAIAVNPEEEILQEFAREVGGYLPILAIAIIVVLVIILIKKDKN